MSIWALSPLLLLVNPTLFGIFPPHPSTGEFIRNVALIWLVIGVGGLLFRTIHLFFIKDIETGLAWATKILTDPFHDIMLYHKAPLYLMRGELIDPMHHVRHVGIEPAHHTQYPEEEIVEGEFAPGSEGG
jgi:hypothetical protein